VSERPVSTLTMDSLAIAIAILFLSS